MKSSERRRQERIVIAGASVNYTLESGETGSARLENLTKNSVCIHLKQRILVGQPIDLELIIPDKEVIAVKAKIVWVLPRGGYDQGLIVGIQFRPFGEDKKDNVPDIERQMDEILTEFQ